jgi:hypothetical protein
MQRRQRLRMIRQLWLTIVMALVLAGLLMACFSSSIQQMLTLPGMAGIMMNRSLLPASATAKKASTTGRAQMALVTPGASPVGQSMPSVLAQDTFQRMNQQFWGHSLDGRMWMGDANVQQSFTIQDATGQIKADRKTTFDALLGPLQTNVNVLVSGSVNRFGDGVNFGVVLRWKDPNNWYKAFIDGDHLSILKRVNGQATLLRAIPFVAQVGQVYSLRFQSVGVMLFASVWRHDQTEPAQWQIVLSDMDLTSGQAGLRVLVAPGTVMNVFSFLATPTQLGTDS